MQRSSMIQRHKKHRGMMEQNKKIVFYSLSVLTILVICGMALWFSTLEKWEPPVRPEKIPQDAIWAGGYDGGCFILLQSEYSDTCRFTIYDDHIGNIWYDGYFYCDKNDYRRISMKDWRNLVACYNGVYVFMKDPENKKREIVWRKVKPSNVPNDAYWVQNDNDGWFFCLLSEYSDTSHFIIYEGTTGEILRDGSFSCSKNDFECIAETEWSNLLERYTENKIVMTDPNDKSRHIVWHPVELSLEKATPSTSMQVQSDWLR